MRTLFLDIETAPNTAFVWGLFDQNVSPDQMINSSYVLCWSARWDGRGDVMFASVQNMSRRRMLGKMHKLLDEADVVVHFNGRKFDIPVLQREFIKFGFRPPSPYKQVDLYQVCKSSFRFESNKLTYITKALDLGEKVKHEGFSLWVSCMEGDPGAWRRMERYNRGDVRLLETLYRRLRPWIHKHPSYGAHDDIQACPKCGSEKFQQRGYACTAAFKYRRYQCGGCHGWFRGTKTVSHRPSAGKERMTNIAS